jgi:hypothetical protein
MQSCKNVHWVWGIKVERCYGRGKQMAQLGRMDGPEEEAFLQQLQ